MKLGYIIGILSRNKNPCNKFVIALYRQEGEDAIFRGKGNRHSFFGIQEGYFWSNVYQKELQKRETFTKIQLTTWKWLYLKKEHHNFFKKLYFCTPTIGFEELPYLLVLSKNQDTLEMAIFFLLKDVLENVINYTKRILSKA